MGSDGADLNVARGRGPLSRATSPYAVHRIRRCGFQGLAAKVQTALEENPLGGNVYIFRGRRGDLVAPPSRSTQCLALADPAAHTGPVKRHAVARRDRRLPVQRLVVGVLRDEDVRQQARMSDASLDRQARHRRLGDGAATWAN